MSSLGKLPKCSEIVCALTPLADKYFELGTQLEVDYKQLKAIENDHKGNQSRCLIETIILWQQNDTTGECSWSTLAEAVNRVGGHDKLVSELRKRDMARDLLSMEAGSKPQMLRHPLNCKRANEGCLSVSDLNQSRPQRYDSRKSEDESGYSSKSESGDSEAECFELAPGCGCTDKKPCSLYTLCAGGCPNPTRKRVPILRKKSKAGHAAMSSQNEIPFEEEYDFEDYEEKTKVIHKSFGIFLCETAHQFEISKVDVQKLTLYVQGAYPVMKPRMEELSKATHFEYFFRVIVDQACSWFDYGIIKDLILLFCTSAKSCLDQYEACFKKYAEQRLPKGMKHIEIGGGARKGGKQLVIKIDREWEEVTFSDLDKLRGTFASILDIRRSDLYLADIREGCIMMTFMITEELAGRLFPSRTCLTSSQIDSLKDEGVLSVKCGSLNWRAVASNNKNDTAKPETRAKMVPQNSLGWRLKIFDIRVMMMVMLLLAFVFTAFGGLLLHVQAAQVDRERTQADLPTLPLLQESTRRSSGSLIAHLAGICPAHVPIKEGPTSSRLKETSKRVPVIDSNKYIIQSFLNASEYQQFFEDTDAVVECPAFFGDQQGVICTHDNAMVVTDDRFSLIIQNIQQNDSTSAVYRCSITTRLHESPFITVNVLVAPRIVEPSKTIVQVIYNHYKNIIPILHRDAQQFLEGNYTCGYYKQAFYIKILAPPPNCSKEGETRNEEGTIVLEICEITSSMQLLQLRFQRSIQNVNGKWMMITSGGQSFIPGVRVPSPVSGLHQVNISNDQGSWSALHRARLLIICCDNAPEYQYRISTTEPPEWKRKLQKTDNHSDEDSDDNIFISGTFLGHHH